MLTVLKYGVAIALLVLVLSCQSQQITGEAIAIVDPIEPSVQYLDNGNFQLFYNNQIIKIDQYKQKRDLYFGSTQGVLYVYNETHVIDAKLMNTQHLFVQDDFIVTTENNGLVFYFYSPNGVITKKQSFSFDNSVTIDEVSNDHVSISVDNQKKEYKKENNQFISLL